MIKRTLYFGNPAYLRIQDAQLRVMEPEKNELLGCIPIEDVGVVVFDHPRITTTQALLCALQQNNVAVISCNEKHHPLGLMLPMVGHSEQTERYRIQINASEPLRKQLWAQTIYAKIKNQSAILKKYGANYQRLDALLPFIKTGDPDNVEGRAAAIYWQQMLGSRGFTREREGCMPNAWLNYGYAIIRATMARALVSSGLLPSWGIFHRNKYNPYCLADDIMEPYRPYCDDLVITMLAEDSNSDDEELTREQKARLLTILNTDVIMAKRKGPLMVGMSRTTSTLFECYSGERRKIIYPEYL